MHKPALPLEGTDSFQNQIRIVLIETSHSGNIGAVARAMKNMGLGLDRAHVVSSIDEALADCVLVMGTSARGRKVPWPVMAPPEAAAMATAQAATGPVALVFGRENHGLSNEELHRCHYHIHIPSNPEYSSLNLAMAVQVVSYELRMHYLRNLEDGDDSPYLRPMAAPGDPGWDVPPAPVNDVEGFFGHLEQVLVDVDFHRRDNPRQLMTRLRRLFQRARMDQMEINILRGVLTAVQKAAGTRTGSKSTDTGTGPVEQDKGNV